MGLICSRTRKEAAAAYETSTGLSTDINLLPAVHSDAVFCVASCRAADGAPGCWTLSGGEDRAVVLYDWARGRCRVRARFEGHSRCVNSVATGERSSIFWTASRDCSVRLWSLEPAMAAARLGDSGMTTCSSVAVLSGHEMSVSAVATVPDGRRAASGGRDCTVRIWDAESQFCVASASVSRNVVTCLRFIPGSESVLLQCGEDLKLRVWDVRVPSLLATVADEPFVYLPRACDVRSDGLQFAISCNGFNEHGCEVHLWDARRLRPTSSLSGHTQAVLGVCYTPGSSSGSDADRLVSVSQDRSVRVWDDPPLVNTLRSRGGFTAVTPTADGVVTSSFAGGLQRWCWRANPASATAAASVLDLTATVQPPESADVDADP